METFGRGSKYLSEDDRKRLQERFAQLQKEGREEEEKKTLVVGADEREEGGRRKESRGGSERGDE